MTTEELPEDSLEPPAVSPCSHLHGSNVGGAATATPTVKSNRVCDCGYTSRPWSQPSTGHTSTRLHNNSPRPQAPGGGEPGINVSSPWQREAPPRAAPCPLRGCHHGWRERGVGWPHIGRCGINVYLSMSSRQKATLVNTKLPLKKKCFSCFIVTFSSIWTVKFLQATGRKCPTRPRNALAKYTKASVYYMHMNYMP